MTIQSINGKPFDPEANYVVVSNDFTAGGGDTYYAFSVANRIDTGITLDEVVMDYITDELKGTVTEEAYGQPAGRITVDQGLAFTDVAATSPYYDGIEWAVDEGITNGTTATTFTVFACNSGEWRITEEFDTEAEARSWVDEQLAQAGG